MPVTRLSLLPLEFVVFAGSLALGYYTPRRLRFIYALAQLATIVAINLLVPLEIYRANDYAFNILGWGWMYRAVEFFIISDPYEEYYWVGDRKKDDAAAESTKYKNLSAWGRWQWIWGNLFSLRGAGWSWAIAQMPKGDPAGTPRRVFVWHQLQRFAAMYVLQDIGRTWLSLSPYVQSDGLQGTRTRDLPFFERIWTTIALGLITFMQAETVYVLGLIVGSLTGLFWAEPEHGRPMYDEYKECYTLRRFWGRVWHQLFRRAPQTISQSIAWDVLRVKKGSLTSRYVQLYLCFAMSGFFHWMPAKLAYPEKTFYNTFAGFIWQANGIVIEDVAIWAGQKAGFKSPNWKYLGYVWFLVFISWSAPLYHDDCVEGGWLRPETWPVSLIRGLWKGEWKANTV